MGSHNLSLWSSGPSRQSGFIPIEANVSPLTERNITYNLARKYLTLSGSPTRWDEGSLSTFTVAAPVIDLDACYVYIAWGDDRTRPLYVGKSREPIGRIGRHLREATWCYDVRSFDFSAFATEQGALDAEARAIRELNPIHNIHRGGSGGRRSRKLSPRRLRRFAVSAFQAIPPPIRGISPEQAEIVARVQRRRGNSWGER